MKRLFGLLFLPLVLAPASANAYITEIKAKERTFISQCVTGRIESDIYVERMRDGSAFTRTYFYIDNERMPFITYDPQNKVYIFDFNRDGKPDKKKTLDEFSDFDTKEMCRVVDSIKK